MTFAIRSPMTREVQLQQIERPSREKSESRPNHLLWLDKNENTDPIYLSHIKNMINDVPATALFGYPDCYQLYKKLSNYLGQPINQLFFAAGSDGIIRAVYEAFVSPGDTVIYTEPTFAMYALYAQMFAACSMALDYERTDAGPNLSAEKLMHAIEFARPRLVCLPNPNSPSGTVFTPDELKAIINVAYRANSIILIDEAYYPFYPESAIDWIDEFENLIIARTFSKAWGLAGIRIGYGIGNQSLMNCLHKMRPMYEAGALSVMLASKILDSQEEMLQSVKRLNAGKDYFSNAMRELGFKALQSEGNFLHVAFADYADQVHLTLQDKVLYRKNFSHSSLQGFSRFTATTEALFNPIVSSIQKVVKGMQSHERC